MRKEIGEFKSYVKVWKQLFPIVTDLHSKCPIWEEKLENCLKFNFFISVNETKGMFEQIQWWKVKTHVSLFSMLVIEYAQVWINMHDHTFVQQDILFCFPMFWNKSFAQFVANLLQNFQLGVIICCKIFNQVLKSALIRGVNCGEDYDHHYRRKSRMELTRVLYNPSLTIFHYNTTNIWHGHMICCRYRRHWSSDGDQILVYDIHIKEILMKY